MHAKKIIIVGGGIGGLAAAMALTKQGVEIELLEQAPEIGEIGAGIQLGPNAYAALDALGAGKAARERSVFSDAITMMDAVDAKQVVRVETGAIFQKRFGNPYGVIHRVDIHKSILEAVEDTDNVTFHINTRVVGIEQDDTGVRVIDQNGNVYRGDAVIGADGVRSVVRDHIFADSSHRVTGHVVYRAVIGKEEFPEDLRYGGPVLWAGPKCHLVQYPLRGGEEYNIVVTFHSRHQEEWGVTDGSKEEVLSYFQGIDAIPAKLLELPKNWRRWATADREPVDNWTKNRATILGDAAHPVAQYMAQGACMALEDAVTLGEAFKVCDGDIEKSFALYQRLRIPRTARIVWSTREMGRIYHAEGVERQVRNAMWKNHSQEQFYDAISWLYSWDINNCLKPTEEWILK